MTPPVMYPPPHHRRWVLAATIVGSSMAFMDGTVVNIALPAFQSQLGATIAQVQWVVEAYTLFLASLMLTGGALGDRLGRRRVFMAGVVIFAAGSIGCGLAPGIDALIAFRGAQGVGAALMVPGSLAIISATFPDRERGKAIGTWSALTSVTMVVGPLVGGALIDHVSWRAIFFVNPPFALVVLFLALRFMPESRDASRRSLDLGGAVLATAGLGALVFGVIESSARGFAHPLIAGALALGAAFLVAFVLVERRGASPMMPPELFRTPTFAAANLLTLFLYGALAGSLFFVPMNLIELQGFSATQAGAAMIPSVLILSIFSRWTGDVAERVGARRFLVAGPLVVAVAFALFTLPGPQASYWTGFLPAFVLLGSGMALTVAPLTTTVMTCVSRERSGIASGINNAVSEGAGLLAVAILGLAMSHAFGGALEARMERARVPAELREEVRRDEPRLAALEAPRRATPPQREAISRAVGESFVTGFRLVMGIASGLALLSALCAWLWIGKDRPRPAR